MAGKTLATAPFLGITLFAVLLVLLLRFSFKSDSAKRLFSAEELALYTGTDEGLPILLGILGSVFDVTKGKSHYGLGGGYNHFAGRDAFVLLSLGILQVKSVVEWRDFYFKTYKYVGKLVGRYDDRQGNATKYLKRVEAKAARGAQLLERQKIEETKQPSCSSRWSQDKGGEVWCDVGFSRSV